MGNKWAVGAEYFYGNERQQDGKCINAADSLLKHININDNREL